MSFIEVILGHVEKVQFPQFSELFSRAGSIVAMNFNCENNPTLNEKALHLDAKSFTMTLENKILSQTVLQLKESATLRMAQLARDLKRKGRDVISLSIGEPDFDTPEFIREAAKKALDEGWTHYTPVPGLPEFRQAIVEKLKRDNDLTYEEHQIVVSNGAKQSISNICQALINPGDEVIIFTPYWVSYIEIVRLAGGVPILVKAGIDQNYKVKPEQVAEALSDKTKFVLFSSPSNPTGSVYTKEELKALADVIAPYENTYIVSDEIYEYILFEGEHHSIGQNKHVFDRTIIVNGMSKGFAMTGWRLGYMAAPAFIAKACSKIQGQCTSGASAFGQMAAAHALRSDLKAARDMTAVFKERRALMIRELRKINGLKVNKPTGAFYIFPDCNAFFGKSYNGKKITSSDELSERLLMDANVATVAGAAFGAPECIRLSYAASESQLMEACKRLQVFFEALD